MEAAQNDRLMHYLSLARTADTQTACQIITDATSDPQLHVFSELLSQQTIATLANTSAAAHHRLLQLFAHGTISDYQSAPSTFPSLTTAQQRKLRLLTLVSLSDGRNRLPYDLLRERLAVTSDAEVEEVVVEALYAGLVRARMDQRLRIVEISTAAGRDVMVPDGIQHMAGLLSTWVQRAATLVGEIDDKIAFISEQTRVASEQKTEAAARVERARRAVLNGEEMRNDATAMVDVTGSDRFSGMSDRRDALVQEVLGRRAIRSRIEG